MSLVGLLGSAAAHATLYVQGDDSVLMDFARDHYGSFEQQLGITELKSITQPARLRARVEQGTHWVLAPENLSDQRSPALFRVQIGLLSRFDFPHRALAGRVGFWKDDLYTRHVITDNPELTLIPFDHTTDALMELTAGTIDAVLGPIGLMTHTASRLQLSGLAPSAWFSPVGVSLHTQDPRLLERAGAYATRYSGDLQDAFNQSLWQTSQPDAPTPVAQPWVIGLAGAVAVLLMITATLYTRIRRAPEAPSRRASLISPTSTKVDSDSNTRAQAYLAEVNTRLQQEIRLREAKEKELRGMQTALEQAYEKLDAQSRIDPLTQIHNRRHFDEVLEREWQRHARAGEHLSVVLADVDYFKRYNDTLGHPAGDECLKRVARALSDSFGRPGDCVARYGGEEFIILLSNTQIDEASQIIQRVVETMARLNLSHPASDVAPHVTLSMGIAACVPIASDEPWYLVDEADQALYAAKQKGRNQYEVAIA